jgi:hypothetical protein
VYNFDSVPRGVIILDSYELKIEEVIDCIISNRQKEPSLDALV